MAEIHYTIRKGLYDRLTAATNTLRTAITQTVATVAYYKLYYHIAPQKVAGSTNLTLPYVTFQVLPIVQGRDSATKWYTAIVQFSVASETLGNCETVMGYLVDRLEDSEAGLSFTGATIIAIERQSQRSPELVEGVWNASVDYQITLQQ
jgi:hypothetical protein